MRTLWTTGRASRTPASARAERAATTSSIQALNYGDSAFDVRNRLVFSPLYIVPKFAGSDLLGQEHRSLGLGNFRHPDAGAGLPV